MHRYRLTKMSDTAMIRFVDVSKQFASGHLALDGISFSIDAGEFVFLLGTSGSGKTTLLRLILRELVPTSGQIFIASHDLSKLPSRSLPMFRRQVGAAFQDFKLLQDKTAFENVAMAIEILGRPNQQVKDQTAALLEKVGLKEKMFLYPSQLSGGEIQRVAIARAIATEPVLLFADEPTGNLDPETSIEIIELLKAINEAGTTIIMATHEVGLCKRYGYRQLHMKQGKLIKDSANKHVHEDKEANENAQ